ncbi:menaquinone-dependent protoporphyrinogen IX dehydrogenase [Parendozoicomonas sp. Alg238-R29]|uniref:menaquinone-dependent protoporphyrinogen IX dehydrogenase n=1 Tax=Parendozoicomonas sp. Alg238-R29 TaxID=2993446 RepID=UPI00248EB31B|nr:menaquinone-dependent protoporphyrinogen IX dehydrogenase [Parendozoicomonas sp. Alg238-R29]
MSLHLVLYASHDGQTARIAKAIFDDMESAGLNVQLENLDALPSEFSLSGFDSVLVGAPIRYGYHLPVACQFIDDHKDILKSMKGGFFSINLTARKPEKQDPLTNRYMQKFLKKSPWQPEYLGVLAGSLLYSRYGWFDRFMIQLIMKITGGNTDASKDIEYTSWARVKTFAQGYIDYLNSSSSSH